MGKFLKRSVEPSTSGSDKNKKKIDCIATNILIWFYRYLLPVNYSVLFVDKLPRN